MFNHRLHLPIDNKLKYFSHAVTIVQQNMPIIPGALEQDQNQIEKVVHKTMSDLNDNNENDDPGSDFEILTLKKNVSVNRSTD